MSDKRQSKQRTRPKKGKPIVIPVPKRDDFEQLVSRAAKGSTGRSRRSK